MNTEEQIETINGQIIAIASVIGALSTKAFSEEQRQQLSAAAREIMFAHLVPTTLSDMTIQAAEQIIPTLLPSQSA